MESKYKKLSIENIILALYFFITPFEDMMNFGYGTINRYLAVAYIFVAIGYIYKNNVKIKLRDPVIFATIIMLMIPMYSIIWAIDKNIAIVRNQAYLLLSGMFLITYIRKSNDREFKLIKIAIKVSGVVMAIYMLTMNKDLLFAGRAVLTEESGPNGFAAQLVLSFFINFNYAIESIGKKRLFSYFFSGLILLIILMTGSRGALVALVAAFFIFIIRYVKINRAKKVIRLVFGIFLLGSIVFQFIPQGIIMRYFGENAFARDFQSSMSRSVIWRDTVTYLIPERPLWGYGSGNGALAMQQAKGYYMVSHNTYLNMVVEYGILFLPFFISFVYNIYKKIKFSDSNYSEVMSLTSILIIAFFLNAYAFKSFWNVFIYLGLFINTKKDDTYNHNFEKGVK